MQINESMHIKCILDEKEEYMEDFCTNGLGVHQCFYGQKHDDLVISLVRWPDDLKRL